MNDLGVRYKEEKTIKIHMAGWGGRGLVKEDHDKKRLRKT